jgi:hypothetical protein
MWGFTLRGKHVDKVSCPIRAFSTSHQSKHITQTTSSITKQTTEKPARHALANQSSDRFADYELTELRQLLAEHESMRREQRAYQHLYLEEVDLVRLSNERVARLEAMIELMKNAELPPIDAYDPPNAQDNIEANYKSTNQTAQSSNQTSSDLSKHQLVTQPINQHVAGLLNQPVKRAASTTDMKSTDTSNIQSINHPINNAVKPTTAKSNQHNHHSSKQSGNHSSNKSVRTSVKQPDASSIKQTINHKHVNGSSMTPSSSTNSAFAKSTAAASINQSHSHRTHQQTNQRKSPTSIKANPSTQSSSNHKSVKPDNKSAKPNHHQSVNKSITKLPNQSITQPNDRSKKSVHNVRTEASNRLLIQYAMLFRRRAHEASKTRSR